MTAKRVLMRTQGLRPWGHALTCLSCYASAPDILNVEYYEENL